MLHPKKVGTLPVEDRDEEKQTNEIKTAIPLLDAIDIRGKTITADALLTQHELARYLVEDRGAHYHFTIKCNQKKLLEETAFYFEQTDREPDFSTLDSPDHGRIENSRHYIIDWNYDEDRSRICKGHGPENMTRLRRFAVGLIKSKEVRSVALKMHELTLNSRLVFDYLKMTRNTCCMPVG